MVLGEDGSVLMTNVQGKTFDMNPDLIATLMKY